MNWRNVERLHAGPYMRILKSGGRKNGAKGLSEVGASPAQSERAVHCEKSPYQDVQSQLQVYMGSTAPHEAEHLHITVM